MTGEWRFGTESDDGTKLYVSQSGVESLVVDNNGVHGGSGNANG